MRRFLKSFKYAANGIKSAFLSERNMRVHLLIAVLIVIFAYFFGLNKSEWAVLFITIAMVFAAEMFNTAIECTVNTATDEYKKSAMLAKDTAAGAVLVCAIFAVIVGFMLFFDIPRIISTLTYIFTTPHVLIVCITTGILGLIFVTGKCTKK